MTGPVVRRDPRHERGVRRAAAHASASPSSAPADESRDWTDQDFARCLVVLETAGGGLTPLDRALLGAARQIAGPASNVIAVAFAALRDDLHAAGADAVLSLPALAGFRPAAQVAALATLRQELRVTTVLLGETGDGADLGRRLAIALQVPLATDVVAIDGEVVRNPGRGDTEWAGAETPILLVTPVAFAPYTGPRRTRINLPAFAFGPVQEAAVELHTTKAEPDAVALEEAPFIISAGAGVSDWNLFELLVSTLRATRGGSRVACDAGNLPRDRQIGASGKLVTADCYVALGISGAPQHLNGIEGCGYVIAVNSDRRAPIFGRANLGFVADADQLMKAALELHSRRAAP